MRHVGLFIAAWLAASLSQTAPATVYKWIDSDGQVVYSQTPPEPGASPAKIPYSRQTEERPAGDTGGAVDRTEATRKDRELKAKVEGERAERDHTIGLNCENSKSKLASLTVKPRVRLTDENGNLYFASPAEHEAQIAQAKADVEEYCR